MHRIRLLGLVLTMAGLFLFHPAPSQSQTVSEIIELTVAAGYEGFFRENHWFPLRVRVRNDGEPVSGRLTIRPETSGRVVSNAYSTPIDMPTGSEKEVFLYVQARAFPPTLTLEFLDDNGLRIAERPVQVNAVDPTDRIHIVVSGSTSDVINLIGVRSADRRAVQARWTISNLPDMAQALSAVDTIVITNIDSSALSTNQRQALRDWVRTGGHLIVTGGPNWRNTAEDLGDLLPLEPTATTTVESLQGLADFVGLSTLPMSERAVVTTGDVRNTAQVLASNSDGIPLLVRGRMGDGLVDYLVLDPSLEPLRTWAGLTSLWYNLATTRPTVPGWQRGVVDVQQAATAIAVLPGIELLPPVESMMAFLLAYILVIGPVNYWVLTRLNRRNWAWLSIPVCIILFSVLAWRVGFNLRGNEVILSRLNVVRAWADQPEAHLEQLVGLLSPRREAYTLLTPESRSIRVLPGLAQTGILAQNITQSSANISQTSRFAAQGILVDGGIFANFSVAGTVENPGITGRLTLVYRDDETQTLQGFVRNDGTHTLRQPVILARGLAYQLNRDIAPGELVTLNPSDLILAAGMSVPPASILEYRYELPPVFATSARDILTTQANLQTTFNILNLQPVVAGRGRTPVIDDSPEAQDRNRREALLRALARDQFGSTARGNQVYIAGWVDDWPRDITLEDVSWQDVSTTLFLVALPVEVDVAASAPRVTIRRDQFTWIARQREAIDTGGLNDMLLISGSTASFRFTPQPGSVLRQVQEMTIFLDRTSSYGRLIQLSIWNWDSNQWELVSRDPSEAYPILDPAPYLGPNNAVELQIYLDSDIGTARIRMLGVEQTGTF